MSEIRNVIYHELNIIMLFQKVKVGDRLPHFRLLNQDGKSIDIIKYFGKPLIIYFYPKDDTIGCTKQACSFRDEYHSFSSRGVVIFGISADSVQSHKKLRAKSQLPFDLLSDKDNIVRDMFGVPTDLFGLIPGRVTYIADSQGIVIYIYNNQMNIKKHIEESLRILKSL